MGMGKSIASATWVNTFCRTCGKVDTYFVRVYTDGTREPATCQDCQWGE